MKRTVILASVAAATLFAATAAEAGHVNWSIGINLPSVATYVSSGPAYYPAPVVAPRRYYAPPAVYVEPVYAPVYEPSYEASYAPVYEVPVYQPRVVYREPSRVYEGRASYYAPRPSRAWLPPLPPLPRLPSPPWSHHGDDRGHDHDRDHDRDRGHDRVDYRR